MLSHKIIQSTMVLNYEHHFSFLKEGGEMLKDVFLNFGGQDMVEVSVGFSKSHASGVHIITFSCIMHAQALHCYSNITQKNIVVDINPGLTIIVIYLGNFTI
ncbi:hypothetical protein ACOSQ3_015658 [Xanthoceras sorbifolium]